MKSWRRGTNRTGPASTVRPTWWVLPQLHMTSDAEPSNCDNISVKDHFAHSQILHAKATDGKSDRVLYFDPRVSTAAF